MCMYLISVYFDEKTNATLCRQIQMIAKQTGNTFMVDRNVPPHLTISQIEARDESVLLPYMESLRGMIGRGEIRIVAAGMLLPYVLCAMPVLNGYLQEVSETVYRNFSEIPETTIFKYYKPMSWMPHITLGKTLNKEQMQQAVMVMQEQFVPLHATVTEIGLAKVNPHEDLLRFAL